MNERRKQARLDVALDTLLQERDNSSIQSRTVDVSQGGALIDSPAPLERGTTLELSFSHKGVNVHATRARVLRCDPAFGGRRQAVAVQFTDSAPQLMKIARLVYYIREKL